MVMFFVAFLLGAALGVFAAVVLFYVCQEPEPADGLVVPTSTPRPQHRHKGGWGSKGGDHKFKNVFSFKRHSR